ncbi:MAG: hypothetical protein IKP02_11005 [Paludibacteraceae bacterium]|nr:hypothetical protein [Paludibacteraceae bacterium]
MWRFKAKMTKRQIYHIIEWGVAIAACGYLVWRLATYDDYASLVTSLRAMGWKEWGAIVLCVALMPVNMGIEAWRWKTLMNGDASLNGANGEMIDWREAQRQVYYSKLAGLITPWRLGEYPARGVLMAREMEEPNPDPSLKGREKGSIWSKVLSMGAVGSATMTVAIIIAGVVAGMISNFRFMIYDFGFSYIAAITFVLILLGVALYFAPRLLRRWAEVSHRLVVVSIGQSLVRLVCWCVQLALVLYALGAISYQPSVISSLFIYYLLVTITPNVPIAEAGVRGAWAIVVFGTVNAALAGVLLWGINTLLPCLIWFVIKRKIYQK